MTRIVSGTLTLGMIFWGMLMPFMFVSLSVAVLEELGGGGGVPEWRHWLVGVGGVLASAATFWVWWTRRSTGGIGTRFGVWALLVSFPMVAAVTTLIVMLTMGEFLMAPGSLVWWLVPSSLVAVVGCLVVYQMVKVASQMPLISIAITLAMAVYVIIASMVLAMCANIINPVNGWPIFYDYFTFTVIVAVVGIVLYMWLPRLAVSGITQGWLRAQLATFVLTTALFTMAAIVALVQISGSPWALQPLIIPAELAVILTLVIVLPMRISYFKPGYQTRSGNGESDGLEQEHPARNRPPAATAAGNGESDGLEQEPQAGSRAWFDPRANEWILAFSANMRAQNYQENRGHNPATDDWFGGWYSKAYIARLFLPSDFISALRWNATEDFGCLRMVTDRLFVTVQRQWEVIKLSYIGRYPSDLSYEPNDFRNERVRIATDRRQATCQNCDGDGEVYCPPTQTCSSCYGSGLIPCSSCNAGIIGRDDRGVEVRCGNCVGSGYLYCGCVGGQVTCSRCGGTGRVRCDGCDGEGIVVQAMVTTKRFTHAADVNYQVEGLDMNVFKNGLKGNHFNKLQGTLIHQEMQDPTDPGVIRQQLTATAFYICTCHYDYKGKPFTLNHIYPYKYVAQGLPWSWRRIAVGFAVAGLLISAVTLLAWLL